jgi:putative DNA primase/helicase
MKISLQNLTKYDGYQRAELANKLLNYASEINGKLEAAIFKQLASGEPVEARQIYGKPFTMRDYGRLMFNCNELPKEVESTNAFFRRFIIIPFDQVISEEEQDTELTKKIVASELSGVFNWLLAGLRRIISQKAFTRSATIRNQVDTFRKNADSVALFIEDEGYTASINKSVFLKRYTANTPSAAQITDTGRAPVGQCRSG